MSTATTEQLTMVKECDLLNYDEELYYVLPFKLYHDVYRSNRNLRVGFNDIHQWTVFEEGKVIWEQAAE